MFKESVDFNTEDLSKLKISSLRRIADYWQRQYLLKHAVRNGYNKILCPIRNTYFSENKMQASHFIDRSKMCTRYDGDNVWLISSCSNMWDAKEQVKGYKSKHHKDYEEFLIYKIGQEKLNDLVEKSENFCILQRKDYIDIIQKFRNEQ